MKNWIEEDQNNTSHNTPTPGSSVKSLYANVHRDQQTPYVKHWLHNCKTILINVLGGITCGVQPFDVSINKPSKNYVHELFKQHVDANLKLYVDGKLATGESRVLITKSVGQAFSRVKKQDLTKHSFKNYGLSNNLGGNDYALTNIKVIEGYKMPLLENEFQIEETDSEDDDDDVDEFEESS